MGYHEWLLLNEALGTRPVFVVDLKNGTAQECCVGEAQTAAKLAEVLGAIEYANGGAHTPWGARRAAAGHPAPFGLTSHGRLSH
jgi:alpha-L-arabinofuranosidase